jgi:CRP-like cAMP-binding protein
MPSLIEQLQSLATFQGIAATPLMEFVDRCQVVDFSTRDRVLSQGGDPDVAYLVIDGMLEVSVQTQRTWHHVAEVHPGDIVGESALFVSGIPRNATVFAHKDSRCLVIHKDILGQLAENPAVVALEVGLIATLSRRIRKTNLEIQAVWREEPIATSAENPQKSEQTISVAGRLRRLFQSRKTR